MNEQFKSNLIYKFWNGLKIRWKIISIILPTAIIPLVIIIVFSNIRIYNHLEKQGKNFYSTLITQVNKNIDLIYEQYGRTLANMMTISSVQAGLYAPPYKSKQQENDVKKSVMGDATTEGGFRSTAEEKIDGNVHIYELDRKSLLNGTDYTVHILNASVGVLDFNKLLNDPLYLEVKNNNKIRMIFGKLKPGVSSTPEYDARPTIILPYYQTPPEKETDTFTKFVVISLNNDFIPKFFEDMEPLRFGTLYILDRFDNIISLNHPSSDYYYDYDDIRKCYVLGEDDPNPEDEPMNFNDFKIINTDEKILEKEEVKNMLDSTEWGESTKIINFKGREYLA
ncbi:MAG TPA: hypothetical protein PLO89_11455, partial [Spirochaetota bacterium]|nr:hypothetical protein [Spirochaetota bacterium]